MNAVFIFLALLFIKHYVVDFVLQTEEMVKGKGIYGNPAGIHHSVQHAVATGVITFIMIADPFYWVLLPLIDLVTHYHIDWVKMNYSNRDITTPAFWNHLGLDQLAHYLTYLLIVGLC